METARAARAKVHQGSIGNHDSGERRAGVDPHRAVAANSQRSRDHSGGLIVDRAGAPVSSVPVEEFATKDSELLACDVECRLAGVEGFYLELDIPGLDELIGGAR